MNEQFSLSNLVNHIKRYRESTEYKQQLRWVMSNDSWKFLLSKHGVNDIYQTFREHGIYCISIKKPYGWKHIRLWVKEEFK